ncbi:MAG: 4-hydroxy-3-methylbut-2-enyl diphosphate reductase [Paludibacteraceae bacterium]|nr:4-hydroxy-3-methylbut-2-enyl diphosphate reductase [Paludibacteraceae bacterium]MCR5248463.1 4-hydroxy-3-methylbut-2-enyl diphosphate reductase [Paludibacteraceae bacterium]MDD5995474.1 4-hydroxy-3-methylbut-2-enyl diphosphate reductase [Bacteroidales bacterium]MEE1083075.1 4-hydroxy-3-methylbut-2-enyl diphosphate reductase [Paludibacteraceae bacterium]
MIIDIDENSGFCPGVVSAIKKAEDELLQNNSLYCLGDIVHNSREVERLTEQGLETIGIDELQKLKDTRVLLRAHGEPPSTYDLAKKNNISIIDATCPVVLALQRKIKTAYEKHNKKNTQIVIYGKVGHAEVNGLVGQTNGTAIVVENLNDIDKIDFSKDICLFSQTTKSIEGFNEIIAEIQKKKKDCIKFEYFDTICRQVANRIPKIISFVSKYELIYFVCGKKSSNGKVLYEQCKKTNPTTLLISGVEDIDLSDIKGKEKIGICGATSTPKWQMEAVRDYILNANK